MSSAGGPAGSDAGGGGGAGNAAFLASLPETIRTHEAFKDVKDVTDLATRYHGTVAKPFAEQLPEAIRGEAYFKDVKSIDDLATRAFHQSKMIGRDPNSLFAIPGADDKDGWGKLYTALGRPESADKYALPKRADGSAYSEGDIAFQKEILPVLHEAGATQAMIDRIVPKWNEMQAAATTAQTSRWDAAAAEADKALRTEFGGAYDAKMADAKAAIDYYGTPELKAELQKASRDGSTVLGDNPHLARLLAKAGAQLREDGLIGKNNEGFEGALSPAEAQQQLNALKNDPAHVKAWTNKNDPDHVAALEKQSRLYAMAYPD